MGIEYVPDNLDAHESYVREHKRLDCYYEYLNECEYDEREREESFNE